MNRFSAQRALEALRNGVPNGDAVRLLGCMQPEALDRFQTQLNQFLHVPLEADPPSTGGIIISGGFGSGKSHTLSCFEIDALERNFIVSRIVISKETPLHDPTKLFLAAVRNAKLPEETRGPMLQELAGRIDYRSAAAAPFVEWTHRRQPHQLLAASATIHEQSRDPELKERMVDWWSGGKIELKQVRDGLKGLEVPSKYTVRAIKAVDLAPVRFEFASRLARAAGFAGWVLLLDESELIARYSLLQRARSYAELTRWLSGQLGQAIPGILAVAAITDDFDIKVLNKQNDLEKAPARLRQKGDQRSIELAALAETGMEIIASKSILLRSPIDDTLTVTFAKLARVYEKAYGYRPEDGSPFFDGAMRRQMRSYVRRWIGTWDLDRLYGPGPRDFVEEDSGAFNYTEDAEYESGEPVGETL